MNRFRLKVLSLTSFVLLNYCEFASPVRAEDKLDRCSFSAKQCGGMSLSFLIQLRNSAYHRAMLTADSDQASVISSAAASWPREAEELCRYELSKHEERSLTACLKEMTAFRVRTLQDFLKANSHGFLTRAAMRRVKYRMLASWRGAHEAFDYGSNQEMPAEDGMDASDKSICKEILKSINQASSEEKFILPGSLKALQWGPGPTLVNPFGTLGHAKTEMILGGESKAGHSAIYRAPNADEARGFTYWIDPSGGTAAANLAIVDNYVSESAVQAFSIVHKTYIGGWSTTIPNYRFGDHINPKTEWTWVFQVTALQRPNAPMCAYQPKS